MSFGVLIKSFYHHRKLDSYRKIFFTKFLIFIKFFKSLKMSFAGVLKVNLPACVFRYSEHLFYVEKGLASISKYFALYSQSPFIWYRYCCGVLNILNLWSCVGGVWGWGLGGLELGVKFCIVSGNKSMFQAWSDNGKWVKNWVQDLDKSLTCQVK